MGLLNWLQVLLLACMVMQPIVCNAVGKVLVDDSPACEGAYDHTACWQEAIDDAVPALGTAYPNFGKLVGAAGRVYAISDTLVVRNVHGGEIDGQGATLFWKGAPNIPACALRISI
jgi:hypothetical protein